MTHPAVQSCTLPSQKQQITAQQAAAQQRRRRRRGRLPPCRRYAGLTHRCHVPAQLQADFFPGLHTHTHKDDPTTSTTSFQWLASNSRLKKTLWVWEIERSRGSRSDLRHHWFTRETSWKPLRASARGPPNMTYSLQVPLIQRRVTSEKRCFTDDDSSLQQLS